ncbi:bifunctional helix-turn-helix transcriptional regulator/GNAT family N-acetyltransferase [Mesorhizobium sp. KR9-304]|uniref:bifunctional helix-turn-helix transcriptional regulator/GNAT family N-acetyltransferase n=1 Tax=Mesorhizobium sp. KR9-304 TaxID=3156614 RepID=UPI0032B62185
MLNDRRALIAEIRRFNRFYTRLIGLLEERLTSSIFTLTEARVLFELGHRTNTVETARGGEAGFLARTFRLDIGPAASQIAAELRLDPAYLTRILRKFAADGLTDVHADPADGRRRILSLTPAGSKALAGLQAAADQDIGRLTEGLSQDDIGKLGGALDTVQRLLGAADIAPADVEVRPHRIGDIGWVIQRQAQLYAEEYGWNDEFEALLAEIGGDFIRNFRAGSDFCWIAERAGSRLGAIFLVHDPDDSESAKLRMLHVERGARGHGIGGLLADLCIDQARACGYRELTLWTNDILVAARRIYEQRGFVLLREEQHRSFGKDLVGQYWRLDL